MCLQAWQTFHTDNDRQSMHSWHQDAQKSSIDWNLTTLFLFSDNQFIHTNDSIVTQYVMITITSLFYLKPLPTCIFILANWLMSLNKLRDVDLNLNDQITSKPKEILFEFGRPKYTVARWVKFSQSGTGLCSFMRPSGYSSVHPSVCSCMHPSVCSSVRPFFFLFVNPHHFKRPTANTTIDFRSYLYLTGYSGGRFGRGVNFYRHRLQLSGRLSVQLPLPTGSFLTSNSRPVMYGSRE